jgi:type IV secretion system protein VirD4
MYRKKKILVTLVASAIAVTLIGFVAATQFAAASLGYQRALGVPLSVAGLRLYAPWSWLSWTSDFGGYAPAIFRTVKIIGWLSVWGTWGPLMLVLLVHARRRPTSTAHGSAAWGSDADLQRAGMLGGDGVVLCQTNDARFLTGREPGSYRLDRPGRLITHNGPEHIMCFAPTRSGKGIGTVIPTLLSWRASALVYDIKKELWTRTAGWRRQFSRCLRFEPTARDSVRFNPLLEVRPDDGEVRDVQNIADILVDPDGSSEKRDHWKASAHTLLVGAILHVLYAEKEKSLAAVARFLSNPAMPIYDTFGKMLITNHLPSGPHPVVAQYAREMMDKSENELAGIVSTAKTCLNLYNDPLISRNTATSDFRIADLMNADEPLSLYLVVAPSDIDRTRPLIRLMLNQIGRRLTERMEFGKQPGYRHRLLILLDEFPSLGKLSFFETQLAFIAGYGIKAFLIAQSLNQLQEKYGQNNSILDNCHVRMTYFANDEKTAKRISELVGQSTHTKLQRNYNAGRGFFRTVNESEQEHARPLITPDEVSRLPYEDAILLVGGQAPYRARKVMYYLDPRFKDRADWPTPDSERQRRGELPRQWDPSFWETLSHPKAPTGAGPFPDSTPQGPSTAISQAKSGPVPVPSQEVSYAKPGEQPEEVLGAFAAFYANDADGVPGAGQAAETAAEHEAAPSSSASDDDLPL